MPFSCIFQLNNGAINKNDEVIFIEFIESAFDKYEEMPTKIAKVIFNGKEAFIYTNCSCYISSKGDIKNGEIITEKTKIGYFAANGEDIPYYKPYATIRFK
ncbi:MAG: hypothetical protein KGL19_12995 [Bacteroidota bacterium]|nr:hypothetical protein [Bacteroidota bacterium]